MLCRAQSWPLFLFGSGCACTCLSVEDKPRLFSMFAFVSSFNVIATRTLRKSVVLAFSSVKRKNSLSIEAVSFCKFNVLLQVGQNLTGAQALWHSSTNAWYWDEVSCNATDFSTVGFTQSTKLTVCGRPLDFTVFLKSGFQVKIWFDVTPLVLAA